MARNHLPGGVDLTAFGRPLFAEAPFDQLPSSTYPIHPQLRQLVYSALVD